MPVADLGGLRLHYRQEGAADAPMLALAHSLGTDLSLWDPIVARLSPSYRILRWDMRGHGKSAVVHGPAKLAEFGRDFLALLEALDISSCHFAGISLGAILGLWLGIYAPESIGKLVVANTAARIGKPQVWDERIALVRSEGLAPVAAGSAERWFSKGYRDARQKDVARVTERLASSSPEGYVAACAALRDADLSADLFLIQARTLVVTGTGDRVTTPDEGHILQRSIPHARSVELPAAHLAPIECAADFSEAVLAFLAEKEEPRG